MAGIPEADLIAELCHITGTDPAKVRCHSCLPAHPQSPCAACSLWLTDLPAFFLSRPRSTSPKATGTLTLRHRPTSMTWTRAPPKAPRLGHQNNSAPPWAHTRSMAARPPRLQPQAPRHHHSSARSHRHLRGGESPPSARWALVDIRTTLMTMTKMTIPATPIIATLVICLPVAKSRLSPCRILPRKEATGS